MTVRDSGTGMTPDVQSRMFDPFYTTKEDGRGTGLGLSTVLGVVQQSNGFIISNSEPGQGTTFDLFFPALDAAVLPSEAVHVPIEDVRGTETVLLVEDNPALRDFATRALRSGGYKVLAAGTGEDALELAARESIRVDVLVSDVVMPGMSGIDLAAALLSYHPTLKVLFVSGHVGAVLERSALIAEADLLRKPFGDNELLARVREVIDRKASNTSRSSL
jgi:CheY-like chemotaxis protein